MDDLDILNLFIDLVVEFDEFGFEPTILCDTNAIIDNYRLRLMLVLKHLKSKVGE